MKVVLIVVLTVCLAMVPRCRPVHPPPPPVHPPRVLHPPPAVPDRGWAMVAHHTGDLDAASRWTVVESACVANDLVDAAKAPNLTEAVKNLIGDFGPLQARIQGLAEDLRGASTWEERQQKVGVFVVCESA